MRLGQAPLLLALGLVGAGLAVTTTLDWQPGVVVVAAGVLLAAGLRLALPARTAGWLVVRSRAFDAAVLGALGVGLLLLATTVPRP